MGSFEERFGDGCRILRRGGLPRILDLLLDFSFLLLSLLVLVLRGDPWRFFFFFWEVIEGDFLRGLRVFTLGILLALGGTVCNVVRVMFFF